MLKKEDLQEIDSLGEELEEDQEDQEDEWEDEPEKEKKYSVVPLLQLIACVLILSGLLYFKMTDQKKYNEVVNWYKTEISQEIELPQFEKSKTQEETNQSSAPVNAEKKSLEKI